MKSLNLVKPLMILMVGLPGSGKSFFAKRFSETFGAPVVSQDRLQFELFSAPSFTPDEQDLVARLMSYQTEELLKSRATFIVDGGCNTKTQRQGLSQIAQKGGYDTLIIWVQTHEATARNRATKRSNRRQDDAFNHSLSIEYFTQQTKRLSPPHKENVVVISGMHTYSTQAKTVLRKLVAAREAEASAAHASKLAVAKQQTKRPVHPHRNVIVR